MGVLGRIINELMGKDFRMFICAGITVVALAIMLALTSMKVAYLPGVMKMVASTGFMGLAIIAGASQSHYGWMILAALFFSWWGVLFLISTNKNLFLLGLISFFLGHVGFGAAFLVHGVNIVWAAGALAVLLVPMVVVLRWLNPNLGDMRYPVYAYIGVITLMVALSAGACGAQGSAVMVAGAILFYLSDIFVARDRFMTSDLWNRYVGLPLYYAAQLLMAYTVALVS